MAYLRCTQCGAKALSVASQCPRCSHPFDVHDARGMRVKLAYCRGCGFMHRADKACSACGVRASRSVWSAVPWQRIAAIMCMVTVAGATWRFGPALRAARVTPESVPVTAAVVRPEVVPPSIESTPASDTLLEVAPATMVPVADTMRWVPAVARTWVNVRSDASRGGTVVGIIKPASRAMLGVDRAGWRLVKSPDVSGWVDPRLFEADSARSRGE